MSSGERPIGAAKGKQIDTEALCQTPRPCQTRHWALGAPTFRSQSLHPQFRGRRTGAGRRGLQRHRRPPPRASPRQWPRTRHTPRHAQYMRATHCARGWGRAGAER